LIELHAPAWRQVAARVARHLEYGAGHHWLELDVDAEIDAPRPGQFIQILLPAHTSPVFLPRPMSVAGVRRFRGGLRLSFLYAPVGAGTQALALLEPGATMEILGPLGRGFPLEAPGTPLLMAGGRGVAPLLFAAQALARAGRRSEFLFGARSRRHLIGVDDARRELARIGGRLHVCTDDGSRGFRGNVVALLDTQARRFEPPFVIHACGPHAMLKAIADWSLARGVPAHLAMESVMACGTGVCRGCPLPRSEAGRRAFRDDLPSLFGNREFAMCCAEGPVFEAGELDWSRIQ
jgi:dihydroorotate dehydrogenase electron transfer subunit